MSEKIATCRYCGDQGIEDDDDPAPGVCPECFEKRMAIVTKRAESHGMRGIFDGLLWAGMTPDAAIEFIANAAIMAVKNA